jgi:uncharacterized membrane protein
MESGARFTKRRGGSTGVQRRTVASFPDYAQAERAVDYLSDQDFPVERVAIVGRDLRLVEQVTGRMGYLEAAMRGLASGALAGLLIGWLFAIFDWFDPAIARGWLIIDGFWFGALVGLVTGVVAHALTRGRRDFASIQAMAADHYDVEVDETFAEEAERLLQGLSQPAGAASPSTAEQSGTAPVSGN